MMALAPSHAVICRTAAPNETSPHIATNPAPQVVEWYNEGGFDATVSSSFSSLEQIETPGVRVSSGIPIEAARLSQPCPCKVPTHGLAVR